MTLDNLIDSIYDQCYWTPQSDYSGLKKRLELKVENAWKDKIFPHYVRKGLWIAGLKIEYNFFRTSISYIYVGPKPPSYFRTKYVIIKF